MTFRLISWPEACLGVVGMQVLNGPAARTSGQNTASDGTEQSFSGIGELLAVRLDLMPATGVRARRQRGLIAAIGSGAVGVRVPWFDRDRMTLAEAGVTGSTAPADWSEGNEWTDGVAWAPAYPPVGMELGAVKGATYVHLSDEHWGHELGLGDVIGFEPLHFGWYWIVGVEMPGTYRIWPPLRAGVLKARYATLTPTAVFRAVPGSFAIGRDGFTSQNGSLELREVLDPVVRSTYTRGEP